MRDPLPARDPLPTGRASCCVTRPSCGDITQISRRSRRVDACSGGPSFPSWNMSRGAMLPRRHADGLRAFGLGGRTGIDLPGETAGILRKPESWREIDLANHGFGQGVGITPIQLAVA